MRRISFNESISLCAPELVLWCAQSMQVYPICIYVTLSIQFNTVERRSKRRIYLFEFEIGQLVT